MRNARNRLCKLELMDKPKRQKPVIVSYQTHYEDPADRAKNGESVTISGGPVPCPQFHRKDYNSDDAFWQAVEARHQRIFGYSADLTEKHVYSMTYEAKPNDL